MKKLDDNWLTNGILDFEYKKYILLAYLKHVEDSFDALKLYPPFADLIMHYRNAEALKANKTKLLNSFPKQLKSIDLRKFKLFFEAIIEDDYASKELEEILNFSLNEMQQKLRVGKSLFDEIERQLEIELIGVSSLDHKEGLLVVDSDYDSHYHVYQYKLSIFETAHEQVKGLKTVFIERVKKSLGNSLEQVKIRLIKQLDLLSNFTTYHVKSWNVVPFEESLMPVVKRSFSAYLDQMK